MRWILPKELNMRRWILPCVWDGYCPMHIYYYQLIKSFICKDWLVFQGHIFHILFILQPFAAFYCLTFWIFIFLCLFLDRASNWWWIIGNFVGAMTKFCSSSAQSSQNLHSYTVYIIRSWVWFYSRRKRLRIILAKICSK